MEFSPKDIDALLDEASVYARVAHLRSSVIPSPQATARLLSVAAELEWILCRRKHLANDSRPTRRIEHALCMCRAAVAPVRRLPCELLIMIFELALPENWEEAYVMALPDDNDGDLWGWFDVEVFTGRWKRGQNISVLVPFPTYL